MAFNIRQCSKEEAIDILNDRSIVRFFSQPFTSLSDDFLCLMVDEIMLAVLKQHDDGVEIHIACKFRDRSKVKQTIINGLMWLKSKGITTIWTTVPDDRKGLINLIKSLGFQKADSRWVYGI